jgi:putative ABC transport system substrate-binding protein
MSAIGTKQTLAVMNASKTIPIVHPNAIDPLNTGLIASLAHPCRNVTGGAQLTAEATSWTRFSKAQSPPIYP